MPLYFIGGVKNLKKAKVMVHAMAVLLTFSGTCAPLVANAEQLVSTEKSKVDSSVGTSENLGDSKIDTAVGNATVSVEQTTPEQSELVTDQSQDISEPTEVVTDQTQEPAQGEPVVDQTKTTTEPAEEVTNQPQVTPEQSEPIVNQTQDATDPIESPLAEAATPAQDDDAAVIKEIGKGENFNGKLYLNYIGEKLKDTLASSSNIILVGINLSRLLNDQLSEANVKERFDVEVDTIRHLITTYLLYDIAFAKDSAVMSAFAQQNNDGTTPVTYAGFYPNTQQLKGTTLNNQDGKMMDVYSYYVDQHSDKTVIIHGGFRGNWNNGIVTDEYNDFYQAGYNMIFVDSRATGASGGDFVTYGQYESDDVLYWINREVSKNPQQKILLYGGSMGAATMMSVLAKNIPANVKGIIENCGFKSIDEQLRFTYSSTIVPMLAPLLSSLELAAGKEQEDLYLGLLKEYYFDREMNLNTTENLPVKGMMSSLPKLIIHGSEDSVVPATNAQELYDIAGGYKDLLVVEGADHGDAQTVAPQAYQQHVTAFMDMVFNRSVTVKYVDENNKSLLTDQESLQLQGAYGDSYQTEQKEFAGYKFVKVEGAEQGVFNETTPTIVYHYKKVTEKPGDNGNGNGNGNSNGNGNGNDNGNGNSNDNGNGNGNGNSNGNANNDGKNGHHVSNVNHKITKKAETSQNKKALPRTGELRGMKMTLIGSLLVAVSFVVWFYRKRKGGILTK